MSNSFLPHTFRGGGYDVTVNTDRSIKVRPNDWLSKYSMAIYGNFNQVKKFKEKVEGRYPDIKYRDIESPDLIKVGNTVYHPDRLPGEPSIEPAPGVGGDVRRWEGRLRPQVILTFDDGPDPAEALKSILVTLQTYKLKSEFYLIGKEVKDFPTEARMIADYGHIPQNHTWDHPANLDSMPLDDVRKQIVTAQDEITKATGKAPTKLRPPYGRGRYDSEVLKAAGELGLKVQNWNVDTTDWKDPKGLKTKLEAIKKQLDDSVRKGIKTSIILLHVQNETARDLPDFIATLVDWDFAIVNPMP